ncbi:MAG TPA: DUF1800 domain-containing protein [Dehalococcoidia bacterium]|jgi:uncharacterized protein (DUF1800 family)|nr:DUF1800 domain-containing protein [Dehalococcoidia bacterium]HIK89141.1 DUF1800 domain-containing protein [Dehalococcoidia bacterium]
MASKDVKLMAHLMRRAGFGASRERLDELVEQGYDETVESLLSAVDRPTRMTDNLIRRYHPEYSGMMGNQSPSGNWMYRMVSTDAPLREKVGLMWHGMFATGYSKLANGKVLHDQIRMFERHGMGSFKNLLTELSRDPAMIVWLDNSENHNGSVNENYGRELLELFSMGVGNYTEQDVKEAARAFTGWTIGNTEYMTLKSARDSVWPYGRLSFHFEYKEHDHDSGEKEFLGHKGNLNGEDIIDIICEQPATAAFLSRHMYSFFVADEPPVPEWPYKEPRDPEAIAALSKVYFDSDYNVEETLRFLFKSDFFKSEGAHYQRVKSPAELVAGVLRLTGEFDRPKVDMNPTNLQSTYMGQWLLNPPSVEGWHWGTEWIDSGALVERVNFASERLGNIESPGVQTLIDRILSDGNGGMNAEELIERALDELSVSDISYKTRSALVEFAEVQVNQSDSGKPGPEQVANVLKLVGATPEFQRA